ncbi:MAG: HU family DNA-binding protein [Prevotella sp.]|nr:HU family DNA-binding protein [Prevotella sp.]
MAVFYRLYQNNHTESDQYKKWYGRSVAIDKVTTDQLAEEIEANCTVKRADILAVLSELVVVMKRELQNSKRVCLDRFGAFKIGVSTKPADTAKDFNVKDNVKGMHIIFQPELHIDATGRRVRSFLDGCKVAELPVNINPSAEAAEADEAVGTGD